MMITLNKGGFQWQNWDMKTGYKPIQWRPTVVAPLCSFCNKTVYPAEEVVGGSGQRFHKLCLKCTSCNTLLNRGNLNEHKKKIYCLPCYRREFGPQGIGRSLRTISSIDTDTRSTSSSLDRMETTTVDHQLCERQTSTGSSPSRTSSDDDSRDSNSYIHKTTDVNRKTLQNMNSRSSSKNSTAFKIISMPGKICPRCSKAVYLAEEIKAAGKSFHKRCCTCAHCRSSISGGRYSVHNGEVYDNNCYQRLFGPRGTLFISTYNQF